MKHTRPKFGARQSFLVRACNLLPDIMEIPVPVGSGSTLIGAEQTGRRAFLMELGPLYSDVIVDRF